MNPIILFRESEFVFNEDEPAAMKKFFRTTPNRATIQKDDLVIGRLSVLPFYKETATDIALLGGKLINGIHHHGYIANLANWYHDLKGITPETWFSWHECPDNIPFVLKGQTNSKKSMWRTHMFAENKEEAKEVQYLLQNDSFLANQNIVFRQYIPLKTYCHGLNGQPITDEYRFFILHDQIVAGGYYWSSHIDEINDKGIFPSIESVPVDFLKEIIDLVRYKDMFYVVDVAQTESGEWIVIELNDGCMSGLSCIDPTMFYGSLKEKVDLIYGNNARKAVSPLL